MDLTYDFCKMFVKKRRKSDIISKIIIDTWGKYSNFSFGCPVKRVFIETFFY